MKTRPSSGTTAAKRRKKKQDGPELRDLLDCLRLVKRMRWKVRRRRVQRYVGVSPTRAEPQPEPEPAKASDEGIAPVTPDQSREHNE